MTLDSTRRAFINWVRQVTNYSQDKVIWADQNMPRPIKSYITTKLSAFSQPGMRYVAPPDIDGKAQVSTNKEFVLSISHYAAEGTDPMTVLLNLQDSLGRINDYAILSEAGIAYVDDLLGPMDISGLVDTEYESRAVMDLKMRIPWTVEDANQGVIESVAINALTLDVQGVTINNGTIVVP